MSTNYKVHISYDGSYFRGSQKQPLLTTVQGVIEENLNIFFDDVEKVIFSGRTDTGVHANEQVFNFYSKLKIPPKNLQNALNKMLDHITVNKIEYASLDFNARFSSKSRHYVYLFTDQAIPVILCDYISFFNGIIDESLVNNFLEIISGSHYFDIFKKEGSKSNSTFRTIYSTYFSSEEFKVLTDLKKNIKIYKIEIIGNSFLYRMVRNIIGCLFNILNKKITIEEFNDSFIKRKKLFNYSPADACGLYLDKIVY